MNILLWLVCGKKTLERQDQKPADQGGDSVSGPMREDEWGCRGNSGNEAWSDVGYPWT